MEGGNAFCLVGKNGFFRNKTIDLDLSK